MSMTPILGVGLSSGLMIYAPVQFARQFDGVCARVTRLQEGVRIDLWNCAPVDGKRGGPKFTGAETFDRRIGMPVLSANVGRHKSGIDRDLSWGRTEVEFSFDSAKGVWTGYLPYNQMPKVALRGKLREKALADKAKESRADKLKRMRNLPAPDDDGIIRQRPAALELPDVVKMAKANGPDCRADPDPAKPIFTLKDAVRLINDEKRRLGDEMVIKTLPDGTLKLFIELA